MDIIRAKEISNILEQNNNTKEFVLKSASDMVEAKQKDVIVSEDKVDLNRED